MRRGIAWAAGLAGVIAAFLVRRRRADAGPQAADPAEELRAKLAAARAADTPTEAPPAAAPEPGDPAARRRDVHAEARAAIEEMRGGTDSPS